MAIPKTTPSDHDDIVLIVPFGTRRTGRIVLPPETAAWLRDQLLIALGRSQQEPAPKVRRAVRLHRGQWRA
jgi:hypothetical protein